MGRRRFTWRIYIVTSDGSLFPHWSEETRKRARDALREYKRDPKTRHLFKLKKEGGD